MALASRATSAGVGRPEGRADEPGPRRLADEHARCTGVAAPQVELVGGAQRRREPEGQGEALGPLQVGLLELQPGQVVDLDDGVGGPAGVLAGQGAVLAVQVGMRDR